MQYHSTRLGTASINLLTEAIDETIKTGVEVMIFSSSYESPVSCRCTLRCGTTLYLNNIRVYNDFAVSIQLEACIDIGTISKIGVWIGHKDSATISNGSYVELISDWVTLNGESEKKAYNYPGLFLGLYSNSNKFHRKLQAVRSDHCNLPLTHTRYYANMVTGHAKEKCPVFGRFTVDLSKPFSLRSLAFIYYRDTNLIPSLQNFESNAPVVSVNTVDGFTYHGKFQPLGEEGGCLSDFGINSSLMWKHHPFGLKNSRSKNEVTNQFIDIKGECFLSLGVSVSLSTLPNTNTNPSNILQNTYNKNQCSQPTFFQITGDQNVELHQKTDKDFETFFTKFKDLVCDCANDLVDKYTGEFSECVRNYGKLYQHYAGVNIQLLVESVINNIQSGLNMNDAGAHIELVKQLVADFLGHMYNHYCAFITNINNNQNALPPKVNQLRMNYYAKTQKIADSIASFHQDLDKISRRIDAYKEWRQTMME
ncbi:predicted protein [Naegleria gruberi]|uniref:Predicted protein n=1 Tax=Naegleria gruberi TaxID=5762 RepID=D2VW43_NAEGR|nr:uncharacterized protein NAEGRDRAFT_52722 [Naegleria gruberi]EFC38951.1 predicted protein [Naegleria gruberi]|eukprot:XP_002671695.1 predicted protein [Naegleria gruberi strain NEG-M]